MFNLVNLSADLKQLFLFSCSFPYCISFHSTSEIISFLQGYHSDHKKVFKKYISNFSGKYEKKDT